MDFWDIFVVGGYMITYIVCTTILCLFSVITLRIKLDELKED